MVKHSALNKKSKSSDNPDRVKTGKGLKRDKSTIMRLNMYKGGQAKRSVDGKRIIGGSLMMPDSAGGQKVGPVVRIAPDRRWFGNTRTMSQIELDKFRDEMTTQAADPYSVILKRNKIPMALLNDAKKVATMNLLKTESYDDVFGSKAKRKRPKLSNSLTDYAAMAQSSQIQSTEYEANPNADSNFDIDPLVDREARKDDLFSKGQSKRIWAELYKVLDSSDIVIQVLDARDVPGTRCFHVENHIKKNAKHKHMIIVINKCDLVPSWLTRKWVKILSKEFPTLAFHASITNAFGKGALISLLRQFAKLHADKRQISVGIVGYPNTGKSSVINTLAGKKCCKAAPVPGETKVWQYVALMRRIFLIDCPGVVYDTGDDEVATVLKGVVRAERLANPTDFIAPILERVKAEYMQKQYGVNAWEDAMDFLTQVCKKTGKLLRGGEPDMNNVAVSIINDFQRGKLPYFVAPPRLTDEDEPEEDAGDDETDQLPDNELMEYEEREFEDLETGDAPVDEVISESEDVIEDSKADLTEPTIPERLNTKPRISIAEARKRKRTLRESASAGKANKSARELESWEDI